MTGQKSHTCRLGEVAKFVKHQLDKPKNVSSDPKHLCKNQAWSLISVTLVLTKEVGAEAGGLPKLSSQPSPDDS